MSISQIFKTLILCSAIWVVAWFVFAEWDCDAVLKWWFSEAALKTLWDDRKYFTEQQLEFVDRSLNTYCCRNWGELCYSEGVQTFNANVVSSPYYFDHFKFLLDLQVNGVASLWNEADSPQVLSCATYVFADGTPLDCTPHVYVEFDLPSPMVCHRNGVNEQNGWDSRCDPSYQVMSWVDTLSTSLEISSPSQYRGLFDKFRTSELHLLPPKPSELADIQSVKDLRFMQLGWLMCEEVDTLYGKIIWSSSFYEKTLLAQWGTISQRCQRMIRNTFQEHAWYLKANAHVSMEHQTQRSNWAYRDHMYDNLNSVLQSMSELIAGTYQMLKEMWNEYTNVCSV